MPAAAVIPAPIAYIKIAAVKTLVVGFLSRTAGPPSGCVSCLALTSPRRAYARFIVWCCALAFYFEESNAL